MNELSWVKRGLLLASVNGGWELRINIGGCADAADDTQKNATRMGGEWIASLMFEKRARKREKDLKVIIRSFFEMETRKIIIFDFFFWIETKSKF